VYIYSGRLDASQEERESDKHLVLFQHPPSLCIKLLGACGRNSLLCSVGERRDACAMKLAENVAPPYRAGPICFLVCQIVLVECRVESSSGSKYFRNFKEQQQFFNSPLCNLLEFCTLNVFLAN